MRCADVNRKDKDVRLYWFIYFCGISRAESLLLRVRPSTSSDGPRRLTTVAAHVGTKSAPPGHLPRQSARHVPPLLNRENQPNGPTQTSFADKKKNKLKRPYCAKQNWRLLQNRRRLPERYGMKFPDVAHAAASRRFTPVLWNSVVHEIGDTERKNVIAFIVFIT